VAAAADLFAERGYQATPMSAVADAAGLSQSGVVHHFPDRAALLAAVLERRDVRDVAGLSARRGRPARGWEVLDDMVELARLNSGRQGIVRLYTSLSGEAVDPAHPGHRWLRRHLDDAVAAVESALREAVEDGTAHPDVPATTVGRQLVALMDGLQVQWLMTPEEVDMAGAVAAHVDTVRERWGR
jgi:AcrR family transcriptional regulator